MPRTVLAFGEILWDMLPAGAVLGGAPLNFAYRAKCLGDISAMVSRLGRDGLGAEAIDALRRLGMDTTHIQWDDDRPTGTVNVSFDENSNPSYVITPDVAYDFTELTDDARAAAASVDCFCFGTLAQRSEVARSTLEHLVDTAVGALKLCDINLRTDCCCRETIVGSLRAANILKLNEEEADHLAEMLTLNTRTVDAVAQELVDRFDLTCCVVTLGERGALAVGDNDERTYCPGYRVPLADSLGSGDAFTAAFVHNYLRGETLHQCCLCGNVLGAIVATQTGATTPLSAKEMPLFLAGRPERTVDPNYQRFITE